MQIELRLFFFCGFLALNVYGQEVDSLRYNVINPSVSSHSLEMRKKIGALSDSEVKSDSLNLPGNFDDYSVKLDLAKLKLTSKIDSLTQFAIHDSSGFYELNRLRAKLDSLNNSVSRKNLVQAIENLETPVRKVFIKIDTLEYKINKKLAVLSSGKGSLPAAIDSPGDDFSEPLNIESKLSTMDVDLPTIEDGLKGINGPDMDSNGLGLHDFPNPLAKVKDIKALEAAGKVQDKLAVANRASDQIGGYREELTILQEGNFRKIEKIPDAIESQAENLEEIKALEKASEDFAAIKAKWNDPEVMKEQALNKAKESAVNHFAGHEKELKAAMEKISKLKAKIPDPEGVIDLFAKRQRVMKGKPLAERFVPGLALQFQKEGSFWLDINPYLGFKVSGRWLAGFGWNERLAYNIEERGWDQNNWIYGLRSFVHFKLKEKLWLKADVENMNAPVHVVPLISAEVLDHAWVWSFFAGIKKDIQLSKSFKANVQTLYNIYNPDKRSPYAQRFNVRIGFERVLKRKRVDRK